MKSLWVEGQNISELLNEEFNSSIVAIAASAHALDALYGSELLKPHRPQKPHQQKSSGPPRHSQIRETLKAVFNTGKVDKGWALEFKWLFELRDAAAHAEEKPNPPAMHPVGTSTSVGNINYSVEHAERATKLAISVFRWCADHPRINNPLAVTWSKNAKSIVENFESQV
jgi:hypothetical protein